MKICLITEPNSTPFKRTAINSAVSCFDKAYNSISGLQPDKLKAALKMVPFGEKPSQDFPFEFKVLYTWCSSSFVKSFIRSSLFSSQACTYSGGDNSDSSLTHSFSRYGTNMVDFTDAPELIFI